MAGLAQAVAVAKGEEVDFREIKAWCERESMAEKYREFERALSL